MNSKLFNTLLIVLTLGILGCLLSVALTELTSKETTLLGIVLTILSFIGSWVVSKYFSDQSHKRAIEEVKEQHLSNLRTYALNAAEKVSTLSSELVKLSIYLQKEIEEDAEDESTIDELYLSAYERMESAIHIINTLKSVNDTYLSDWKGVIGEELDEKMEEQQERENELRELVEKATNIIMSRPPQENHNENEVLKLSKQISDLKKDLNFTLNSVSGTFVRTPRASVNGKKHDITTPCPYCQNPLNYKQRAKTSSFKFINCKKCEHKSFSRWNEQEGFKLFKEEFIAETYPCPNCNKEINTKLSNFAQSKSISECSNCQGKSQIIRSVDKFNIQPLPNEVKDLPNDSHFSETKNDYKIIINEDTLEKVRQILPSQPWEKGVHKVVSEKLNLPLTFVRNHISELIKRGVFKPQIDGVLYQPIDKKV